MTPRRNGVLLFKVSIESSTALESYREAVELATANALSAARNVLCPAERIAAVLSLTVFIKASTDFIEHSKIADFASNLLQREFGEVGIASRAAVGVASLPGGAPVEIQMVVAVV